ncbi:MAG: hypothetical protein WCH99_04125 [Verrucomicrobiota bacterium]
MSDKPKFPHAQAMKVAVELVNTLRPYVKEITIAGSLRRGKHFVGDIEILYVPMLTKQKVGLFESDMQSVNVTDAYLINPMLRSGVIEKRPNRLGHFAWGVNNKLARHVASNIPVDFFGTTMENWFVSLVIRTGSKETNLSLTMGAQKLGRTLNAYGCGVTESDGTITPATSEEHVFQLCGVPYKEPQAR